MQDSLPLMRERILAARLPSEIDLQHVGELGGFRNVVEISRLESRTCQAGHGRTTMAAVVAIADGLGVTLCLWPVPDDVVEDSLGADDLVAWYRRLGFVEEWRLHDEDDELLAWRMVRRPINDRKCT